MKRILALLLCILMIMSVFSGCGSGTEVAAPEEAQKQENSPEPEATEKTGRILQVSLEGVPDSLDPHVYSGSLCMWGTSMMHDYLVKYDENMNVVPAIAESWEFVSDTEISFKLREDVLFHNGRGVIAEDVKNTYERVLDPNIGAKHASNIACISEVIVNDDYNLTLKLAYPYSPILARLTQIPIIPIECVDTMATAPVGCGPFKFSDYEYDQYLEMIKFDDYYAADEISLGGIRFTFLSEYNAARTAFLAGDLDILLWTDPNDVPSMKKQEQALVVPAELLAIYYVGFDCTRAPFDDARVRRAVYLALNRSQFVDSILAGNAECLYSLMSGSSPYYNDSWTTEQNIEEAKNLLAEAGYPDGFSTVITTPNTAVEGPIGDILQMQLAAIGIDAEIQKPDVATYLDQVFTKSDFEIMICGTTGFGDPDDPAYTFLNPAGGTYDTFKYQNEQVWELLEKARSVYDEAERKTYYNEAFQIIYEEAPIVPIMSETRYSTIQNYVKGFVSRQNLTYDFSRITIAE